MEDDPHLGAAPGGSCCLSSIDPVSAGVVGDTGEGEGEDTSLTCSRTGAGHTAGAGCCGGAGGCCCCCGSSSCGGCGGGGH